MKEDFSYLADWLDDALVNISCCDAGIPQGESISFFGLKIGLDSLKGYLSQFRLDINDIDCISLLPSRSRVMFMPSNPKSLIEIETVDRLGFFESRKVCSMLGRRQSPVCRSFKTCTLPDGSFFVDSRITWVETQGVWAPTDPRMHRVIRGSGNDRFDRVESAVDEAPRWSALSEWSRRCCWNVDFRLPGSPALSVITDPIGVRELLRMRDVPDGKSRREALRNWTREHWRQNRQDHSVEHRVREHLRGAEKCVWLGLECAIVPSRIDLAKNEIDVGRKLWRKKERCR